MQRSFCHYSSSKTKSTLPRTFSQRLLQLVFKDLQCPEVALFPSHSQWWRALPNRELQHPLITGHVLEETFYRAENCLPSICFSVVWTALVFFSFSSLLCTTGLQCHLPVVEGELQLVEESRCLCRHFIHASHEVWGLWHTLACLASLKPLLHWGWVSIAYSFLNHSYPLFGLQKRSGEGLI